MANKTSGGPRFVLILLSGSDIKAVTTSESNSQAEWRRLKKKAKSFVLESKHWVPGVDKVRVYLVMEPELLSGASLITDLEIDEWERERTKLENNQANTTPDP